jgi:hypothetical protein
MLGQPPKATNSENKRKQKEKGMVVMVGIILVDYLVLTFPGLIVMELGVHNVRLMHVTWLALLTMISPSRPTCQRTFSTG